MPKLTIQVRTDDVKTALQRKYEALISDDNVLIGVNEIIAKAAEKYIPTDTGNLATDRTVTPETVTWNASYAHYQFVGEIYGPNFKRWSGSNIVGWTSPPGENTKYPTGRKLGKPGFWKGWPFGYTTPGTGPNWIKELWSNERRSLNIKITNYLKRRAKEKGL